GHRDAFTSAVKTFNLSIVLLLTATLGFADKHKLAKDLSNVPPDQQVDVIVHYTRQPQAADHDKVAKKGGKLKQALDIVNSAAYSIPGSALADLESNPDVDYISPDRPVAAAM